MVDVLQAVDGDPWAMRCPEEEKVQKPMNDARRGRVVYLPEVIDSDTLAVLQDNELALRYRALDDDRIRAQELGWVLQPWEVELAYVKREQQIRNDRRQAHAEINRRETQEFYASEAGLPSGDVDNFAFVFAASGGRPRWN